MRQPLQGRAQEVWAYLLGYFEDNNFMPTLQEIGDRFGKSRQWADQVVAELERQGHIKTDPRKLRGITIAPK